MAISAAPAVEPAFGMVAVDILRDLRGSATRTGSIGVARGGEWMDDRVSTVVDGLMGEM